MKIKIDVSNFFGMLVSKGIKKMALQATFKNAKAYSLQNGHAGKCGVGKVKMILREYWKRSSSKNWLFEGVREGKHITTRTAEKIFQNACRKAGINKKVTFHSLRHSFATHLLESGTMFLIH